MNRRLHQIGLRQLAADARQMRRVRALGVRPTPPMRELEVAKARWRAANPHIPWSQASEDQRLLYLLRAAEPLLSEQLTAGRV